MTFGGLFVCLMGVAGNSYAATQAFVILAAAGIEVWVLPEPSCSRPCMTVNPIGTYNLTLFQAVHEFECHCYSTACCAWHFSSKMPCTAGWLLTTQVVKHCALM